MKLGLKFNKNTLLSVVFAIVLIVFALYLIKALDKNREGGPSCPPGTTGTPPKCSKTGASTQRATKTLS